MSECKMSLEKCLDCKIVVKREPDIGIKPIEGKFNICNCGICWPRYILVCPIDRQYIEITECIKKEA